MDMEDASGDEDVVSGVQERKAVGKTEQPSADYAPDGMHWAEFQHFYVFHFIVTTKILLFLVPNKFLNIKIHWDFFFFFGNWHKH